MGEIGKFCVTLTEIPVHDMVFTEVLEINAHAHTVWTPGTLFFSLLGTGYQASN